MRKNSFAIKIIFNIKQVVGTAFALFNYNNQNHKKAEEVFL
jgi:hypothetical protein